MPTASARSSLIHSFLFHLAIFIEADSGPGTVLSAKYIQYRGEQGKALLPWDVILMTKTLLASGLEAELKEACP